MPTLEEQRLAQEATDKRRITVGQAINLTRDFVVATADNEDSVEDVVGRFASNVQTVVESLLELQVTNELVVEFNATVEPAGPAATLPTSPYASGTATAPPAAASGPAPLPGQTDGDPETGARWNMFFSDPLGWDDIRGNKKSDKSPDFRHKTQKQQGSDFKLSLWIDDKKNPSWVQPALRERGLI